MIEKIIDFSVKNRLIIGLLTLSMVVWGIYNFTILPIDAVPDITNNQVQVITVSSSLAPQEVEQFITFPLEMAIANVQDVTEIRSISRSGLSVLTIVFKDKVSPYLARQLVSEQIKIAENDIPDGFGKPQMMPITTGLGEIYQYVLEPEPGYENMYDPMTMRTIQDWIIKRYLSGIPGIVEISSFGGFLKQYEVSIKPRTLVAMNITILEVFDALEKNNQNSGGSYIEKGPGAYYIRAEGMVKNKEDIGNIVVKNINGIPVLIKDVADVKISSPPRYGAMTKDGKGEAVGGITLMLKGANTAKVIQEVKTRMEELKETLPEGLKVHAYLDRAKLIRKTINTVSKNLIEGGLIVIFVLVLLLGNYRAGLIVASVIPLSMLFAFSMMKLFGVTANLMSLGAIDFGLIVDGSVIVVEGIMYQLHSNTGKNRLTQQELDSQILVAGKKVSRSAVFGVLIILIVYLPILAFKGIEGKTFRPMAQTVSFALLGALILSLTYVPMMSSLILNKKVKIKTTFSDKLVNILQTFHAPVLNFALKYRMPMVIATLLIVIASFYAFSRLGGEFIPTLEEGDLAAQMTLAPGSSLTESIASSTKAERILLDNFPEVVEVISKIGTAEVPTDPMAIEDADIMIILKKKEEWSSAKTREELVEKMKEKLSVLPGLSFEFQQPIQLRFNELMTGVKSDVAVKIYGEDLNQLYVKANEAAAIIQKVEGAGDVKVEQIVGLPQLVINYKRDKIAQYGLNINDINRVVKMAYAGEAAGVIFEGEKRFDMVVRLCEECRNEFRSIQNLRINPPTGELITLSQVADISIEQGPMQISRDNTKRRITIGINLRNRDVESFVNEVKEKLTAQVILPPGYYITYGGQFENLQDARRTSVIAVPISLAMILILLYFAFYSVGQSIMIFTAIPLAAVGGIWTLYIRGMPFSISAGVGFIALFGVAVLNGIVLISYYNQLKKEGVDDVFERVKKGTRMRLRPVIMTAAVAALGFFPMALSTAPGAEVQKPLASVVIGGLVTSTFLTLVILPVIYVMFNNGFNMRKGRKITALMIPMMMLIPLLKGQTQERVLSLDEAIAIAQENNVHVRNATLDVEGARKLKKSGFDLAPIQLEYQDGQINSDLRDHFWFVRQSFRFPTVYTSQIRYFRELERLNENNLYLVRHSLIRDVKSVYNSWNILHEKYAILKELDSIYNDFKDAVALQFESGDINQLKLVLSGSEAMQVKTRLIELEAELAMTRQNLLQLLGIDEDIVPAQRQLKMVAPLFIMDTISDTSNVMTRYILQMKELQRSNLTRQKADHLPDFFVGYFNQTLDEVKGFQGFQLGASIPLWFWSNSGKVQASKIDVAKTENTLDFEKQKLMKELNKQLIAIESYQESLSYYENGGLSDVDQLVENVALSFQTGDINYFEYVRNTGMAYDIKLRYFDTLEKYNHAIIEIEFLLAR